MQAWADEHQLRVNTSKTEYIVFNDQRRFNLRVAGEDMPSQSTTTYLGFCRNKHSRVSHLKHRLSRTTKGSGAVGALFARFPHLPVYVKTLIAKTCLKATALYGTEACTDRDFKALKKRYNITFRRTLRKILGTPMSSANQTMQGDLGWASISAECRIRRLKLVMTALSSAYDNKLIQSVIEVAYAARTPWIQEIMMDARQVLGIELEDLKEYDQIKLATERILREDMSNQYDRLETKCYTTTGRYRSLVERSKMPKVASYISGCRDNEAVRLIYLARAGNSDLAVDKFARHLMPSQVCRM
jgi:hypothetical protein